MDPNLFQDFWTENRLLMTLGMFVILRKPTSLFVLNAIYLSGVTVHNISLTVGAVYTMANTTDNKPVKTHALQTLALLGVSLFLPYTAQINRKSIGESLRLIKTGVFKYSEEDPEYDNIKMIRVRTIRLTTYVFKIVCVFSVVPNLLLNPATNYFMENDTDTIVNPYLPLPLYMGFDTTNAFGYGIAFMSQTLFLCIVFTTACCLVVCSTSMTVQLIAQVDVLIYSIKNIERRALYHLMKKKRLTMTGPFDYGDFQESIYFCLRENIMHHHAVMRLIKSISPYLRSINGLAVIFFSVIMASSLSVLTQSPLKNLPMLMMMVSDIFCYLTVCYAGQEITDKIAEAADILYCSPWPFFDEDNKRLLKIMHLNLRKKFAIKVVLVDADSSLQTFGSMMSAAYKIFNLIR